MTDAGPARAPFLWRVAGDRPSWLFGTIHLRDRRVLATVADCAPALAACGRLCTERRLGLGSQLADFARFGLGGGPLRDRLPVALLARLEAHLRGLGAPIWPWRRAQIWAVALGMPLLWEDPAVVGRRVLDLELWREAGRARLRRSGLETGAEVARSCAAIPDRDHAALLEAALDRFDRAAAAGVDALGPLRDGWLRGDGDRLMAELFASFPLAPGVWERVEPHLLAERNVRFAERIARRLEERPAEPLFVAVGAAHLIGKGNVTELLAARGHAVERIR